MKYIKTKPLHCSGPLRIDYIYIVVFRVLLGQLLEDLSIMVRIPITKLKNLTDIHPQQTYKERQNDL